VGRRHTNLGLGAHAARALAVLALGIAVLSVLSNRAEAGPVGGATVPEVSRAAGPQREHRLTEPKAAASAQARHRSRGAHQPRPEQQPAAVQNAAGEPLDVSDGACRENLAIAAKHGLTLPERFKLYCVGPGLDWDGNSHWGVTCPYDDCPEGAGPYVSISNPTYYVIAHELCHANFGNDELMADRCAAEHGASLATSPYQ
jgi:hypothetical protein